MCWITDEKIHREPKIAEEDIKVKKLLTRHRVSPYNGHMHWEFNEVYETDLGRCYELYPMGTSWRVNEGFHSCKNIIKARQILTYGYFNASEDGELYENILPGVAGNDYLIFDAIIPKGSMYYVNESDAFVSNKLMITGIAEQRKKSITPQLPFF